MESFGNSLRLPLLHYRGSDIKVSKFKGRNTDPTSQWKNVHITLYCGHAKCDLLNQPSLKNTILLVV